MNKPWTEFTSALEGILDRLLGPYNVEAVVEPIHIKISEAIMNFQESGADLSAAVFAKCGKPKLKSSRNFRRRRNAEGGLDTSEFTPIANMKAEDFGEEEDDQEDKELMQGDRHGEIRGGLGGVGGSHPDDTQPSKSLEKLLKEIKNKVKKSKVMWNVLPKQVCNGISKDYSSQLCWNGSGAIKPDRNKSTEESESGLPPGKGPPNLLVAEQVLILQLITDKLRASYNGLDVQWVQDVGKILDQNLKKTLQNKFSPGVIICLNVFAADDLDFDGSGSRGSGSGDLPEDDLEDSDDDDPSGRIKPERRPPPPITPSTTTTINFNPNNRPKFPLRPAPPILVHRGEQDNDSDEDDDDDDDDEDDVTRNWNPEIFSRPSNPDRDSGNSNKDIDFAPMPPYQVPLPPRIPESRPPPPPPFTIPTTTTPVTTTTTTRRPGVGGDNDVKKTTVNSSGHGGDASSAIAVFKLFSPIIVSMIGKVFSFS